MVALAHQCEALIASRVVAVRTELAGALGFTKARVTQLLDLTLLAPNVQEKILAAEVEPGWDAVTEHALRAVVPVATWDIQRERGDGRRSALAQPAKSGTTGRNRVSAYENG